MSIIGIYYTEHKHSLYRRKDYIKNFCESLREQAKNITNFEKKERLLLTKKELKSYEDATMLHLW